MKSIAAVLRLRPALATLVAAAVLVTVFIAWPMLGLGPARGRAVGLLGLLLLLWVIGELVAFLVKRARDRKGPAGKLRLDLDEAIGRAAAAAASPGRLLDKPWILVAGPAGAGKSTALERAGCRRLAQAGADRPLLTFWMSPEFPARAGDADAIDALFCELSGEALQGEGGEHVARWLRDRRERIEAVLLQIGLDELGREDPERARALAAQLAPLMRRLGEIFPEPPRLHVLLGKLDCVEGFAQFFPQVERGAWGFRLDYVAGEERKVLVAERLQALTTRLWARMTTALGGGRTPAEQEAILDFPREFDRYGQQVGAFLDALCAHLPPGGALCLGEVYLGSASLGEGTGLRAARHERLPGRLEGAPRRGERGPAAARFLPGLYERLTRQAALSLRPGRRRPLLLLLSATVLCVALAGALSRSVFAERRRLRELQAHAADVLARAEAVQEFQGPIDPQRGDKLAQGLQEEFSLDRDLRAAVALLGDGPREGRTGQLLGDLRASAERLRYLRTARRLVHPLLRYERVDELRGRQPLYDALRALQVPRSGRGPADEGRVLLDGFYALKAAGLLDRTGACEQRKLEDADGEWVADYLKSLWDPSGQSIKAPTLQEELRGRLRDFFLRYLQAAPPPLRWLTVAPSQLERARRALQERRDPAASDGSAPLLLSLMIADRGLIGPAPAAGFQLLLGEQPVGVENTQAGCQRLDSKDLWAPWLRCAVGVDSPAHTPDEAALRAYYQQRSAVAWGGWLGQLSLPLPSTLTVAAEMLPKLEADLDALLKTIGSGKAPASKERPSALCQEALRPFAPFRWALGADETGAQGPADLKAAYDQYKQALKQLRGQVEALSRPQAPAAEILSGFQAARASLEAVASQRLTLARRLDEELRQAQSPVLAAGSAAGGAQSPVLRLGQSLERFEEAVWGLALNRLRQAVEEQWGGVYAEWSQALPATPEAREAALAGADAARTRLLEQLGAFRTSYLAPFLLRPDRCEPLHRGGHAALCPQGCQSVARAMGALAQPFRPAPAPAPESPPPPGVPTITPVPTGSCGGAALAATILDTGEKRYQCNVSRQICSETGPSRGRTQVELIWSDGHRGTLTPDQPRELTWDSMAALVKGALRRDGGGRAVMERDPWTGRSRMVLRIPVRQCGKMELYVYADPALLERHEPAKTTAPRLPPWLTSGFLPRPEQFAGCNASMLEKGR